MLDNMVSIGALSFCAWEMYNRSNKNDRIWWIPVGAAIAVLIL